MLSYKLSPFILKLVKFIPSELQASKIFWKDDTTRSTRVLYVLPTIAYYTDSYWFVGGNTHDTRVERVAGHFRNFSGAHNSLGKFSA